jgi:hypothetical protein
MPSSNSRAVSGPRRYPPIQEGEIYCRCPSCGLIGWTADDDDQDMPRHCGVSSVKVDPTEEDVFDVRVIVGAPADLAHHLTVSI